MIKIFSKGHLFGFVYKMSFKLCAVLDKVQREVKGSHNVKQKNILNILAYQVFRDKISKESLIENENANKIQNLEQIIKINVKKESRLEEEKNQYEMMVLEQQKIIRLALARIFPNQNISTKTQFCQV